jgi:hypothetical protein
MIHNSEGDTHDTGRGTERVGGEVGAELGADDTRVTVDAGDAAAIVSIEA